MAPTTAPDPAVMGTGGALAAEPDMDGDAGLLADADATPDANKYPALSTAPAAGAEAAKAPAEAAKGTEGDTDVENALPLEFSEEELELLLYNDNRWTIFEDVEDEVRYTRRRGDVLAHSLLDARAEIELLHEAGLRLQDAHEALQIEVREVAGDAAYWRALAEAKSEELTASQANLMTLTKAGYSSLLSASSKQAKCAQASGEPSLAARRDGQTPASPVATIRRPPSPSTSSRKSPPGSLWGIAGSRILRSLSLGRADAEKDGSKDETEQRQMVDTQRILAVPAPLRKAVQAWTSAAVDEGREATVPETTGAAPLSQENPECSVLIDGRDEPEVGASTAEEEAEEEEIRRRWQSLSSLQPVLDEEQEAEEEVPKGEEEVADEAEESDAPCRIEDLREQLRRAAKEAAKVEPGRWRQRSPPPRVQSEPQFQTTRPFGQGMRLFPHNASPSPRALLGPSPSPRAAPSPRALGAAAPPPPASSSGMTATTKQMPLQQASAKVLGPSVRCASPAKEEQKKPSRSIGRASRLSIAGRARRESLSGRTPPRHRTPPPQHFMAKSPGYQVSSPLRADCSLGFAVGVAGNGGVRRALFSPTSAAGGGAGSGGAKKWGVGSVPRRCVGNLGSPSRRVSKVRRG